MFSRIFSVAAAIVFTTFAARAASPAQAQTQTQPSTQPSRQANEAPALQAGTVINAELDNSIDSKKAKVGDEVKARTTEEIKKDDKTILPKGTRLVGHIVESSARSKGDANSTLAIQFDRALLKHDEELPLNAGIRAIAAPPVSASGADMMNAPTYSGNQSPGNGQTMAGNPNARPNAAQSPVVNNPTAVVGGVDANGRPIVGAEAGSESGASAGGLTAQGRLAENSRGVFGLEGISLHAPSNAAQPVVIASSGKNVHLDSGTRLLLVTQSTPNARTTEPATPSESSANTANAEKRQPNK